MSSPYTDAHIEHAIQRLKKLNYQGKFADAGKPSITRAYKKIGTAAGKQIDIGFDFNLGNPEAVKAIDSIVDNFSKSVNKTAIKDVKRSLQRSLESGLTIDEAAENIKGLMNVPFRDRAEMIARTEIVTASNKGALEAYRQTGVVTQKVWITAGDACPICTPYDGMVVGIEEEFFGMGESIPYTEDGVEKFYDNNYAPIMAPVLHPNCRCCIGGITIPA